MHDNLDGPKVPLALTLGITLVTVKVTTPSIISLSLVIVEAILASGSNPVTASVSARSTAPKA